MTEEQTTQPIRAKLLISLKIAVFVVAITALARVLTVETASIENDWDFNVGLFILMFVGLYFTLTFALWVERRLDRK